MPDLDITSLPVYSIILPSDVFPVVDLVNNITKQITFADLSAALPGSGGVFTPGSVIFAAATGFISQDNANLFWDDTNNRLGIGTATPTAPIDILGAYPSFRVRNTDTTQYAGSSFYLLNQIAGMGNQAGASFYMGIWDASATQGFFAIDRTNVAGASQGHLMLFNYSDDSVSFYTGVTPTARIFIDTTGRVGIGPTSPTAVLHLKAGTAAAGTAPFKLTSGTVLGTTEAGAIEYDGTHLYFTAANAGSRFQLDQQATGLSITAGKTLTVTNTMTFAGTDGTTMAFPAITGVVMTESSSDETTNTATVIAITSSHHIHTITALASANTFGVPTLAAGGLSDKNRLMIRILDNGTIRALSWNAIFKPRGVALPTTTVAGKYLYVGFVFNTVGNSWDCIASSQEI